ncbi:MAG: hypothetical protein GKR96_14755 [Gammaproteobacteria bacterium]|nr:hypothetical protein [Gammaproteobacteria bacterium]
MLLIDEIDRADEAFEAFLLEILSEFTISIPELGTLTATTVPQVILTSNGTRELSDALRRRCLYHYANYPDHEKELAILHAHLPNIENRLLEQVTQFVQSLRTWDMVKRPGVAETLDWTKALSGFNITDIRRHPALMRATLSCLIKTREDQHNLSDNELNALLSQLGESTLKPDSPSDAHTQS